MNNEEYSMNNKIFDDKLYESSDSQLKPPKWGGVV